MKHTSVHKRPARFMAAILAFSMIFSMAGGYAGLNPVSAAEAAGNSPTGGVVLRQADPSTMDTYKNMLNFSENSRYAGRLWTDKSVFAFGQSYTGKSDTGDEGRSFNNNSLELTTSLDGLEVEGKVDADADFLEVLSLLGSSEQINEAVPLDVMFVVDTSSSMGREKEDKESRASHMADGVNNALTKLFTVSPQSRAGIVMYDRKATVLMQLAKWKPNGEAGTYISVSNDKDETSSKKAEKFTITVNAEKDGDDQDTNPAWWNSWNTDSGTNMQAGIYLGMKTLLDATTTYESTVDGLKHSRIPVLIVMSDGGSNCISQGEWYNPDATNPGSYYAIQNDNYNSAVILQTVMTSAYMAAQVEKHYNMQEGEKLPFYTIGCDIQDADEDEWAAPRVMGTLQPHEYFTLEFYEKYKDALKEALVPNPAEANGIEGDGDFDQASSGLKKYTEDKKELFVANAYRYWNIWKESKSSGINVTFPSINHYETNSADAVNEGAEVPSWGPDANKSPSALSYPLVPSDKANNPGSVTEKEFIDHVDQGYVTKYYEAESEELGNVFSEIIESLVANAFTPVGGTNSLGVDNGVTFVDPVGEYMEVKDVKAVTLFGQKYDVVKAAVFDYSFNDSIQGKNGAFVGGWYRDGTRANGEIVDGTNGGTYPNVPGITSAKEAWDAGWVYYINTATASKFVPNLETDYENPSEKAQNTTYTFYRIAKPDADREALHMNPAYTEPEFDENGKIKEEGGKKLFKSDKRITDAVEADEEKTDAHQNSEEYAGVYALNDLRIWVEDTGDWKDDSMEDMESDTNYSEALWVNVPSNMIPLRVVTIEEDTTKSPQPYFTYNVNTTQNKDLYSGDDAARDPYLASFPLRVFYSVGVEDELLTADGHMNIANGVSPEYIKNNKSTTATWANARGLQGLRGDGLGYLEFFSNWYNPENRYEYYETSTTHNSYGDPAVSFAPSDENRYYLFQNPQPIYTSVYQRENGSWVEKTGSDMDETSAGTFGGNAISVRENADGTMEFDLDGNSTEIDSKLNGLNITAQDGDVVFLKEDRLSLAPDSDTYYFMPVDYFENTGDDGAKQIRYCVARRGSDYGDSSTGLCWYNIKGTEQKNWQEFADREHADSQDAEWLLSAKPGSVRSGRLSNAVGKKSGNYTLYPEYGKERFPDKEAEIERGIFQVGYYGGNTTRTANNYYMPTISEGENAVTVNTYLGNNGRLIIADSTVLLTKLVVDEDGDPILPGNENEPDSEAAEDSSATHPFHYQVFIDGFTDERDAIVVKYNSNSGVWERQLHYIDLKLGGNRLLQNADGTPVVVDENGKKDSNGGHYVYVPANSPSVSGEIGDAENVFRVYHNPAAHEKDSPYGEVGQEVWPGNDGYYHTNVYFVAASEAENFDPSEHASEKKDFPLLTVSAAQGDVSDVEIKSDYLTDSAYLTKTVKFGKKDIVAEDGAVQGERDLTVWDLYDKKIPDAFTDVKAEDVLNYTAEVTLTSGYGLLFDGMPSGTKYRFTEKLTDEDIEDGYTLERLRHRFSADSEITYRLNGHDVTSEPEGKEGTTANFDNSEHAYSAFGDVGATEEAAHYVNIISDEKSETQINGNDVSPSDRNVPNKYPGVKVGDAITYKIEWRNSEKDEKGEGILAKIVIADPLDEGVDFKEASDGGVYYKTEEEAKAAGYDFVYTDRTVIWDLGEKKFDENGFVTLTVTVNENAKFFWDYDMDGEPDEEIPEDQREQDFLVRDRAIIVTGENMHYTNTVTNPVGEPDKTETNIGHSQDGAEKNLHVTEDGEDANLVPGEDGKYHGPMVFPGDLITYEITWRNYKDVPARIKIRDQLDPNVEFWSATDNGEYNETRADVTLEDGEEKTVAYKHAVFWDLGEQPAGASGKVTLIVKVLNSATSAGYVDNTAYVAVGNDAEQETKTIENPTTHQDKDEVTPGDGVLVGIGQEITYKITWHNYMDVPAKIQIMDVLDPGVDFVNASDGGEYKSGMADWKNGEMFSYKHLVFWDLGEQPAGQSGEVTLTVRVNEKAKEGYSYNDNASALDSNEKPDYEVFNQARVKVGDDPYVNTDIVENPVPDKDETHIDHKDNNLTDEETPELTPKPDEGNTVTGPWVYVGDEITYTIHWSNREKKEDGEYIAASVTITDPLDPGVDFVRIDAPTDIPGVDVPKYDEKTHSIRWKFIAKPNTDWILKFTVRVNEKATPVGQVDNQAVVKVGDHPAVDTQIIENPTPKVEKTEVSPGEGMQVMPGDEIEYDITWRNYKATPADAIIIDRLDPGVDFVSANIGTTILSYSEDAKKPETANLTITVETDSEEQGEGEENKENSEWEEIGPDTEEPVEVKLQLKMKAPDGKTFKQEGYQCVDDEGTQIPTEWKLIEDDFTLTFTIESGKKITVKDLPVGTKYTLTVIACNEVTYDKPETIVDNATVGLYGSTVNVKVTVEKPVSLEPDDIPEASAPDATKVPSAENNLKPADAPGSTAKPRPSVGQAIEPPEPSAEEPSVKPTVGQNRKPEAVPGTESQTDEPRDESGSSESVTVEPLEHETVKDPGTEPATEGNKTSSPAADSEEPDTDSRKQETVRPESEAPSETDAAEERGTVKSIGEKVASLIGRLVYHDTPKAAYASSKTFSEDKTYASSKTSSEDNGYTFEAETLPDAGTVPSDSAKQTAHTAESPESETAAKEEETQQETSESTSGSDVVVTPLKDPAETEEDSAHPGVTEPTKEEGTKEEDKKETMPETSKDETVQSTEASGAAPEKETEGKKQENAVTPSVKPETDNEKETADANEKETAGANEKETEDTVGKRPAEWHAVKPGEGADAEAVPNTEKPSSVVPVIPESELPEEEVTYIFTAEVIDQPAPEEEAELSTEQSDDDDAHVRGDGSGFDVDAGTLNGESASIDSGLDDSYGGCRIYYFSSAHTVVWVLKKRLAGAEGTVHLKVQVNEDAKKFWDYENPEQGPSENKEDKRVRNKAGVQIGNDPIVETRVIENPTEPAKSEWEINGKEDAVEHTFVVDGDDPFYAPEVHVGDTITYKVTWQNNDEDDKWVVVVDQLDKDVEFISAGCDYVPKDDKNRITFDIKHYEKGGTLKREGYGPVEYDENSVVWDFGQQPSGARGRVWVKVRVLESALKKQEVENQAKVTVGNNAQQTGKVKNPVVNSGSLLVRKRVEGTEVDRSKWFHFTVSISDKDGQPLNGTYGDMTFDDKGEARFTLGNGEDRAATQLPAGAKYTVTEVGADGDDYFTWAGVVDGETVDEATKDIGSIDGTIKEGQQSEVTFVNVKGFKKEETTPGNGETVKVGQEITYEIHWLNYHGVPANVTVKDTLDPGVDFVSANEGGTYDLVSHTVTWNLGEREAFEKGIVTLTVRVNENALNDNKGYNEYATGFEDGVGENKTVYNQARVRVGDDPEQKTEIPENPVEPPDDPGPHKTEETPGNGATVKVGDEITYRITWQNTDPEPATVIIRDPLDEGVDFVSADNGGSYDASSHTVTWTFTAEPGAEGAVLLTVRVNAKALKGDRTVRNQAFVTVGNHPEVATEIPENPLNPPETVPNDPPATSRTPTEPQPPTTPAAEDPPTTQAPLPAETEAQVTETQPSPLAAGNVPYTGDDRPFALPIALLVLSLIGMAAAGICLYKGRRVSKEPGRSRRRKR